MKAGIKLPASILMLATPLAAYADGIPNTGHVAAFVGGAVGGFVGALLACWLCNRSRSKKDGDSKRY
jgi:membrane associated rhomboid family serine protease